MPEFSYDFELFGASVLTFNRVLDDMEEIKKVVANMDNYAFYLDNGVDMVWFNYNKAKDMLTSLSEHMEDFKSALGTLEKDVGGYTGYFQDLEDRTESQNATFLYFDSEHNGEYDYYTKLRQFSDDLHNFYDTYGIDSIMTDSGYGYISDSLEMFDTLIYSVGLVGDTSIDLLVGTDLLGILSSTGNLVVSGVEAVGNYGENCLDFLSISGAFYMSGEHKKNAAQFKFSGDLFGVDVSDTVDWFENESTEIIEKVAEEVSNRVVDEKFDDLYENNEFFNNMNTYSFPAAYRDADGNHGWLYNSTYKFAYNLPNAVVSVTAGPYAPAVSAVLSFVSTGGNEFQTAYNEILEQNGGESLNFNQVADMYGCVTAKSFINAAWTYGVMKDTRITTLFGDNEILKNATLKSVKPFINEGFDTLIYDDEYDVKSAIGDAAAIFGAEMITGYVHRAFSNAVDLNDVDDNNVKKIKTTVLTQEKKIVSGVSNRVTSEVTSGVSFLLFSDNKIPPGYVLRGAANGALTGLDVEILEFFEEEGKS